MPPSTIEIPLSTRVLADWLDRLPEECWWMVDGDYYLTGKLPFPTTSDVFAKLLRTIDKTLLLRFDDDYPPPYDAPPTAENLEDFGVRHELSGELIFRLRWESARPEDHWLLIEDKTSLELAREMEMEED